MGSYYLTVSRAGEKGETSKDGNSRWASTRPPTRSSSPTARSKVGVHAQIKLRLPTHKKLRGEGEKEFTPGMVVRDHRRPRHLQRHPPPEDAVLQPAAGPEAASAASSPTATRSSAARDDRPARPHEGHWASASRPARACRSPPTTCRRRRTRRTILDEAEKEVDKISKQLPARDHHRPGALQQGHRRLDARPRADHRAR